MVTKSKIIFVGMCAYFIGGLGIAKADLPAPTTTHIPPPITHKAANFDYQTIDTVLWPIVNYYTAFPDIPAWYANSQKSPLPMPHHTHFLAKLLTLRDAIWIALRNNPDVKNDEVTRISDKFALAVARWNFEPQFNDNFAFTRNFATRQVTTNTTGGVSLNTPFATNITTGFTNTNKSYFDHRNIYATTITQPLMNGGWLTPWNNYLDSVNTEKASELSYKANIMAIVTSVIGDYTGLVSAYNNLHLQSENLKETKEQLDQDRLRLKTGRMSRSDFLQEEVTYQTDKLGLVQNADSVQVSYQTFLTELGLVPTAQIRIDRQIDTKGFAEPDLKTCIQLALKFNTSYLTDKLSLQNAKRALTNAINGLMPTLTATGTFGFGNGSTTSQSLGVVFSVPIDDMTARQTKLSAKIALEQAKITLTSERQSIISNVTSQWKTIQADIQQIKIAESQVTMQQQVVKDSYLLLQYGRSTMFDYLQQRTDLLQDAQSLVGNKITYMTDVAALDNLMGVTLKRWNIKLRY